MINGLVVGIVKDNVDPDKMNRVLVEYPVDSGEGLKSSWCRLMSPMAGKLRGLVMLPDKDTEVVLAFAYRTMSPYVLGAVYNGAADKPEPYKNDDGNDDKRVFWSRNDHMVIFDDTAGAEKVQIGAKVPTRLQIDSGPIYQTLDSAEKTITQYAEKHTITEAKETISLKCKDFKIDASGNVEIEAKKTCRIENGGIMMIDTGTNQTFFAARTDINPAEPPPKPDKAKTLPTHKHAPTCGS